MKKWVIRAIKGVILILFLWMGIIIGGVIVFTTKLVDEFGWNETSKILGLTNKMIELGIIKVEPKGPEIIEDKEKKMIFVRDGILIINYRGIRQKELAYRLPSLSPDNKRILFLENVSGRDGTMCFKVEIWIMEIDSEKKKRLTKGGFFEVFSFLPDGRIIFSKAGAGIYIIDKGKQNRLIKKEITESIFVSPDGKKVVFEAREKTLGRNNIYIVGSRNIYIINIDDKNERQLTFAEDEDNFNPSFSPDSKEIVFESRETKKGRNKIYIIDVDGRNLRVLNVTPRYAPLSYPSFSPNGKNIVFLSKKKGSNYDYQLCIMNKDETDKKVLIELEGYGSQNSREHSFCGYSFLYDKFIFLLKESDGFNLYTINLDGTDKKKVTKMENLPYLFCLQYPGGYPL